MTDLKYSIGSLVKVKVAPLSYLYLPNNQRHPINYFVIGFKEFDHWSNSNCFELITDCAEPITGIVLDGVKYFESNIEDEQFIGFLYKILVPNEREALWFVDNVLEQFTIIV